MAADRARLMVLRRRLGARLAIYRAAAGLSQPELGQALGRTRSLVSKVENGGRGMPAELWTIADDVCGAEGALVAEHEVLAQAEQDYRVRCRAHHRQAQRADAQAQAAARKADLVRARQRDHGVTGPEAWRETTLVSGELAEELMQAVTRLVRAIGRRDAMQTASWVLAAVGLSDLDPDEHTRLAHAVAVPSRVDAQVVTNLAATLAQCKRQEDRLGPSEVLETAVAQHGLVHRLLAGDCPDPLRRSLSRVDSAVASFIGNCLVNLGRPDEASRYLAHARQAGHDAGHPACAAYAAALASFAAFERADTPTALDTAAAARSLAARTDDAHLKAFAEQIAAHAYALEGQHGPCMVACDRAHDFLTNASGSATPDSPASWFHHGRIDSQRGRMLSLLGKPKEALDAAVTALSQHDRSSVRYTLCEVRLGHALVLSKEITEAVRVLGDAAHQVHLYPRLTGEFHAARALLQPWHHTPAVTALDTHLHACGLLTTTTV